MEYKIHVYGKASLGNGHLMELTIAIHSSKFRVEIKVGKTAFKSFPQAGEATEGSRDSLDLVDHIL